MAKQTLAAVPVTAMHREQPGRLSFNAVMGLIGGFGLLMLIGPTLIVLVTSLTSGFSLKFPPPGLSLRWYRALIFDSPEIIDDLLLSLKLAAAATACATLSNSNRTVRWLRPPSYTWAGFPRASMRAPAF